MQYTKMSPEQAAALARRDRNRLIVMSVLAVLVGAAYLVTMSRSKATADEAETRARDAMAGEREANDELADVIVPPFETPEILEAIRDGSDAEREFLEEAPLAVVFDHARIQTDTTLRKLGIVELDEARQEEITADPSAARLAPVRARGKVVSVRRRPRSDGGRVREDWMGTLETFDGRHAHFLVAGAPVQPDGARAVELGDYLRVDGLFHALYRAAVDGTPITAPLILGARIQPSSAPMTAEVARVAPALATVEDDSVGDVYASAEFQEAFWQLMGRARLLGQETDWENVPELDSSILEELHRNGEAHRGEPYRVPVSINMDTYSVRIDDNPLRLDRQTVGWIGNSTWKGSVMAIKWFGPFTRQDMLRETLVDENRYVTARGYFFRNHVYSGGKGQPVRAPIFVMESVEVFTPPEDLALVYVGWGVAGLTVLLIGLIFVLLRADRKKSKALYEDMIRRKRARRQRAAERQSAAGPA